MAKVKTVDGNLVEEETSLGVDVIDAILAPVRAFTNEEGTFYSGRVLGMASLGYGIGGLIAGHKFGHQIPILNSL